MKKKTSIEKLEKTSLSKAIIKISRPILHAHINIFVEDSSKDWDNELPNYGKVYEIYAKQIFISFVNLCESVNKLEQNVIFLSMKNTPSYYKKNGIREIDYYKYHIENHYIKISSIIDFVTKFIHDVFRLGMPVRKINTYLISENSHTKSTLPAKILNKLTTHFAEIKTNRNIIIHQGNFKSKEITALGDKIISIDIKDEIDKIIDKDFKEKKEKELKKITSRMQTDNEDVVKFLEDIFDGLTKYFEEHYESLKLSDEKHSS